MKVPLTGMWYDLKYCVARFSAATLLAPYGETGSNAAVSGIGPEM